MKNFNPYSRTASFYRYFFLKKDLPNSLCDYSWGLLIASISFPFVWVAMLFNRIKNKIYFDVKEKRYRLADFGVIPTVVGFVFTLLLFLVGIISLGIFEGIYGIKFIDKMGGINCLLLSYITGIGSVIVAVISYFTINGIINLFSRFKKELTPEEKEIKQATYIEKLTIKEKANQNQPNYFKILWLGFKAFKEKNCPLITWDYEKNK